MKKLLIRVAILGGITYLLKRASDPPVQPTPKPLLPNYVAKDDPLVRKAWQDYSESRRQRLACNCVMCAAG